jgi:hypothetical protein
MDVSNVSVDTARALSFIRRAIAHFGWKSDLYFNLITKRVPKLA